GREARTGSSRVPGRGDRGGRDGRDARAGPRRRDRRRLRRHREARRGDRVHDPGGAVGVKGYVIGIGAGDREYVTMQAVRGLNAADGLFLLEKADEQKDLIDLRREIIARYVQKEPRVVTAQDPPRGRGAEAVAEWRRRRVEIFQRLVAHLA